MKLGVSIGVRLDPGMREKLQRMSEATGLKAADLIRVALREQIQIWDRTGSVRFTKRLPGGKA